MKLPILPSTPATPVPCKNCCGDCKKKQPAK